MGFIDRLFEWIYERFDRRTLGLLVTLVIALTLPLTVLLTQQTQKLRQRAAESNVVTFTDVSGNPLPDKVSDPNLYLLIRLPNDWKLPEQSSTNYFLKKTYAQDVPCSPIPNKICGQTAYDTCVPTCEEDQAAYYCYQQSNPNCNGTILCSPENNRCRAVPTPTPGCQVNSSICNQPAYDTCTPICTEDNRAAYFCYQRGNPACKGTILCSPEDSRCQAKAPIPTFTSTPTPFSSPTSTPPSPTPTPAVHVLKSLTIENKDTDGSSGGHEPFSITSNFSDYLNKPVYWKLNELKSDQTETTRVVQVTFFDGTNYFPYIATMTLARPPQETIGRIQFPRDEGQHYTNVEWWYLNFYHLESDSRAGVIAVARLGPPNNSVDVLFFESINVGVDEIVDDHIYVGKLTASTEKLDLEFQGEDIDPYFKGSPVYFRLVREDGGDISQARYRLSLRVERLLRGGGLTMEQTIQNFQKPLLEGGQGYVPIAPGVYSFYYSLTDLRTSQGARNRTWMDHQWFDIPSASISNLQQKTENIRGFLPSHEWFNLQLEDGTNLVFWKIYASGDTVLFENMDLQTPSGEQINLPHFQITDRGYFRRGDRLWPRSWTIQESTQNINLRLTTIFYPTVVRGVFYEWPTLVLAGQIGNRNVTGFGFAEITYTTEEERQQTSEERVFAGDINRDGEVDVKDYAILVSEFGKRGADLQADLDKDGDIDIFDYNIFVENFGKKTP